MPCATCGTENPAGAKFCNGCGASLARACAACGTSNAPGARFCSECGAALTAEAPVVVAPPAAERRLVSVLFADLVGFTSLSEARDAEEVRELLSRYFEACRRLIELYGGTVEKFIGDAVMAVWGTPIATEDDAERAVRAALDIVAAVSALGQEVGAENLRARAGVLTGEAAVTVGALGQGMVAGDLVNTASRIQSAAEPGSVLVGESTRRATEQTVAYVEAGSFELKGKEGSTKLWAARRVLSGRQGALKSSGLEAPFVGRDRELRQIKELFHDAADERRAHLVSVTGIAGIGKSRLGWEFYKYFDGIADSVYWHRGRCLSYGEGVTYWALADMVRMRCRIAEDEEPAAAQVKLRATLNEQILDSEERAFLEPRLAHLLGLAEYQARDKQDLFAAWRLFFERLADSYPTVLAFEDMQWADESLLDFVEYLLDWSRSSPILVITLARPELLERRPTWGAGQRSFTSIYLEPLSAAAMEELLSGLVPGLPDEVCGQILARAEGVPLYAVETVRMLLDRGLLVEEGAAYRLAGPVESLEVPETLHALIAARLDGLSADERRLLQDGAVLGKTFTRQGLAALSGLGEEQLDGLLAALVRKEVLGVQADPRSPEHGQYGFLQDLVRFVAYEMLSKRERRARHLAAAEQLTAVATTEDELVEVVASHYVAAYEAAPDADDAADVRGKACGCLERAGEHARSLAASPEAGRYFEQAAAFAETPLERASLLHRAGEMAGFAADPDTARRLFSEAIEIYEHEGDTHAAARVSAKGAMVDAFTGRRDEALARMERAFDVISADEPDADLSFLASRLAVAYWFGGDLGRAAERAELALDIAESLGLPDALVAALFAKGFVNWSRGHQEESLALVRQGLAVALEHGNSADAGRGYGMLSDTTFRRARYAEALELLEQAITHARKVGHRIGEWGSLAESTYPLFMLGRWDEALKVRASLSEEIAGSGAMSLSLLTSVLEIHLNRGELDDARALFALYGRLEHSSDVQDRSCFLGAAAAVARAEGRLEDALELGASTLEAAPTLGVSHQTIAQGLVEALDAAIALGERERAEELLGVIDAIPVGLRPPLLVAQSLRMRARLAADAESFAAAAARFRELGLPFLLAVTLLEHAELLAAQGSSGEAEPLLASARETFESLAARPWLERVAAVRPAQQQVSA